MTVSPLFQFPTSLLNGSPTNTTTVHEERLFLVTDPCSPGLSCTLEFHQSRLSLFAAACRADPSVFAYRPLNKSSPIHSHSIASMCTPQPAGRKLNPGSGRGMGTVGKIRVMVVYRRRENLSAILCKTMERREKYKVRSVSV